MLLLHEISNYNQNFKKDVPVVQSLQVLSVLPSKLHSLSALVKYWVVFCFLESQSNLLFSLVDKGDARNARWQSHKSSTKRVLQVTTFYEWPYIVFFISKFVYYLFRKISYSLFMYKFEYNLSKIYIDLTIWINKTSDIASISSK